MRISMNQWIHQADMSAESKIQVQNIVQLVLVLVLLQFQAFCVDAMASIIHIISIQFDSREELYVFI